MRQEQIIPYETTIDVSSMSILDSDNGDIPVTEIIIIIVVIGIIGFLYKRMKSKKAN